MKDVNSFYQLTDQTLYIKAAYETFATTKIEELEYTRYAMQSSRKIIEQACINGGASYQGRIDAMKALFNLKQSVPLPISPEKGIFAFSTKSPIHHSCIWILTQHIRLIDQFEKEAIIHYSNGKSLTITMSKRRLDRILAYLYRYHLYFRFDTITTQTTRHPFMCYRL
ncbi:competence protein ComK [Amphibacillus sediminis]|uniref:competence protein ComK n=1 Tax=Amphibacillus sediminis TaxID=360185 RepID=UPI0008378454|nr:competence protein ComK [Amphibacillus sediminis]